MPFFSGRLLVSWTEPLKYGRERARASRFRSKFGIPFAGAVFSTMAVLIMFFKTQYEPPPQPVSAEKWFGLWFVGFVTLSLAIWVVGYIPSHRRVHVFQRSIRIGKIGFRVNSIRSVVWEPRDDYWILRITLDSNRTCEIAADAETRPEITRVFSMLGIPA
jgi:hypothetical protein